MIRIAALAATAALMAAPASAVAVKGGQGKSQGKTKSCGKLLTRGFQVTGTLVAVTMDEAATTEASEASVTLMVTAANRHARNSGEIAEDGTYTVLAGDAYALMLGDEALVPAAGDRVKVKGRVALTKKRCAAEGTSAADRYATPDVTRVRISRPEPETTEPETP